MRILTGRREILPTPCSSNAGRECKYPSRPLPASNFCSVLNSSFIQFCHVERSRDIPLPNLIGLDGGCFDCAALRSGCHSFVIDTLSFEFRQSSFHLLE